LPVSFATTWACFLHGFGVFLAFHNSSQDLSCYGHVNTRIRSAQADLVRDEPSGFLASSAIQPGKCQIIQTFHRFYNKGSVTI
jgi:hypothetical protein